jgi:hypothetical protein
MDIAIDTVHDKRTVLFRRRCPTRASPQEWTTANLLSPKTFDFDVVHKFPPTNVEIRNGGSPRRPTFYLDGDIEKPDRPHLYIRTRAGTSSPTTRTTSTASRAPASTPR